MTRRCLQAELVGLRGDQQALGAMQPLLHPSVYNLSSARSIERKTQPVLWSGRAHVHIMSLLFSVSSLSLLLMR